MRNIYLDLSARMLPMLLVPQLLFSQTFSFTESSQPLGVDSYSPGTFYLGEGLSLYDFDGDGLDDLTVTTFTERPLLLYRNTGSGFEHFVADGLQPAATEYNTCVLWVDHDGDGDLDLGVNSDNGPLMLFERTGNANFSSIEAIVGFETEPISSFSSAWADFDLDGDLDQYVGNRDPSGPQGNRKMLYENNADGTFTDVTDQAMVADSQGIAYQVLWTDFDRDGYPDIHIANDKPTNRNVLYRNLGNGAFEDVSDPNSTGMVINGMGIAAADYDRNGFEDLYVTNDTQSTWDFGGNILCQNHGDGTFTEVAGDLGIRVFDLTWGCNFADFDNDGYLDLFVAIEGDFAIAADVIFRNNGDGTFTEILNSGIEAAMNHSLGSAVGDVNNDGYPDIAVLTQDPDKIFVWLNNGGTNNWVKFRLEGANLNTQAIGTWVEVFYDGGSDRRYHRCGNSFSSQDGSAEMFGLGQSAYIDSVHVIWPTGNDLWLYGLTPNETYTINENSVITDVQFARGADTELSAAMKQNELSVKWSAMRDEKASLSLVAMNGSVILRQDLQQRKGGNSISIDTQGVAASIYLVTLRTNDSIRTRKVLIGN